MSSAPATSFHEYSGSVGEALGRLQSQIAEAFGTIEAPELQLMPGTIPTFGSVKRRSTGFARLFASEETSSPTHNTISDAFALLRLRRQGDQQATSAAKCFIRWSDWRAGCTCAF